MTKTQTEQMAKDAASRNEIVNARTVEDLEQLSWQDRRDLAVNYAKDALANSLSTINPKWYGEFRETYADRVLSTWSNKLKERENARRRFRTYAGSMTAEQASEKIVALLESFNFRGARINGSCLEILRGDRDGGSLYWTLNCDYDAKVVNPDDPAQQVYTYSLELKISTSGTQYSPARMALVHKVHAELLEAAAEVEATFAGQRIVTTYGIPEAVEVPAMQQAGGPNDERLS